MENRSSPSTQQLRQKNKKYSSLWNRSIRTLKLAMTLKAPECTLSGFTYSQSLMFQSFILTSCKGLLDSHNELSVFCCCCCNRGKHPQWFTEISIYLKLMKIHTVIYWFSGMSFLKLADPHNCIPEKGFVYVGIFDYFYTNSYITVHFIVILLNKYAAIKMASIFAWL